MNSLLGDVNFTEGNYIMESLDKDQMNKIISISEDLLKSSLAEIVKKDTDLN